MTDLTPDDDRRIVPGLTYKDQIDPGLRRADLRDANLSGLSTDIHTAQEKK